MDVVAKEEVESAIQPATGLTRRRFIQTGMLAGIGLALYAGEIARHHLVVEEITLRLPRLPAAMRGLRIAQLGDLHYAEFSEPLYLRWVVERLNRLRADIVVITGDFVSMSLLPLSMKREHALRCADILSRIQCPRRYAILGNHDAFVDPVAVTSAVEAVNIPVLRDRAVPIQRNGSRIWLAGADDCLTNGLHLDRALPAEALRRNESIILLAHEPDVADDVARHGGVDLMLSGHTHGGQVRFPFVSPMYLPPLGEKYIEGLHHIADLQLYVNRGIGAVGVPFRFNAPPEITLITLA